MVGCWGADGRGPRMDSRESKEYKEEEREQGGRRLDEIRIGLSIVFLDLEWAALSGGPWYVSTSTILHANSSFRDI
jgi:hypothetical protein